MNHEENCRDAEVRMCIAHTTGSSTGYSPTAPGHPTLIRMLLVERDRGHGRFSGIAPHCLRHHSMEWVSAIQPKKPRRGRKTVRQLTEEEEAWMDCKVTRLPMFAETIIVWIRLTNPSKHSILKHLRRVLL